MTRADLVDSLAKAIRYLDSPDWYFVKLDGTRTFQRQRLIQSAEGILDERDRLGMQVVRK